MSLEDQDSEKSEASKSQSISAVQEYGMREKVKLLSCIAIVGSDKLLALLSQTLPLRLSEGVTSLV